MQKYFHFVEVELYQNQVKLIDNCVSGITILKNNLQSVSEYSKMIDLYGNEEDSVVISKKNWGNYFVLTSSAFGLNDTVSKTVLIGRKLQQHNRYSLYLTDNNRPLSLCGRTKIVGTAFLPETGVKRAYIEGRSYQGDRMIYGNTKTSKSRTPKMDQNWEDSIDKLLAGNFPYDYEEVDYFDIQSDEINQSFTLPTQVIVLRDSIAINNLALKGNVILYSKAPIQINATAIMENILVIAPKIYVQKNAKIQAQLVANILVELDESSEMIFPSAIIVKGENKPKVILKPGATLNGGVVLLNSGRTGIVIVEKNAAVTGQIYSNSFSQIKGKITGSLTTNKLLLKTASSIYENHMLDGEINSDELHPEYVDLPWANQNNEWIEIVNMK